MSETQLSKGLQWVQDFLTLVPLWAIEPNDESIKRSIEMLKPSQEVQISFLTQGAFNKIYNVQVGDENLILRVSLPVDPRWKTLSEVATIEWTRLNTCLPVPKILNYQPSWENEIGFEWILMTKVPGRPLADVWRFIKYKAKEKLVLELAKYSSSFYKNQLRGIGNIFPDPKSVPFCDHGSEDVPRGPFHSSREWIAARLALNKNQCSSALTKFRAQGDLSEDDELDVDDAMRTLGIVKRLQAYLDDIFSNRDAIPEPSMLFHDDLLNHNILVGDDGTITGVVDWECVPAVPLWKVCYYPRFLEDRPQNKEPYLTMYELNENGKPSDYYWEELMAYELTKLRRYFIDEMQKLEPEWVKVFESSQTLRDFDFAVVYCNNEFLARRINEWLDDITSGKENVHSLHDRYYGIGEYEVE